MFECWYDEGKDGFSGTVGTEEGRIRAVSRDGIGLLSALLYLRLDSSWGFDGWSVVGLMVL